MRTIKIGQMNQIQSTSSSAKPKVESHQHKTLGTIASQGKEFSLQDFFELGNTFHKNGELDQAETVFREILKLVPDHAGALHFLGVIARQSGNLDSAVQLIKKAIEVSPNYYTAHSNLGQTYRELGQEKKAKAAFMRAIEENPDYAEAHFNLGLMAEKQRKFEEAVTHLKTSARLNPRHIETYFELGRIFILQGEKINAQLALKTLLQLDEAHVDARCLLAHTIMSIGKYDEALKEYQIALEYNPQDTQILNGIGKIHVKKGRFKQALEYLYKAIKINETDIGTLTSLGSTHQILGDLDTANDYYTRVLQLEPSATFAEQCALFLNLNNPNYTLDELFTLHTNLRGHHDKPQFTSKSFENRTKDPDKKIKIGYLSSDFRAHVVSMNMTPLIINHSHDQFEIYLYIHSKNDDLLTKEFCSLSDHFRFVNTMDDEEVAHLIEDDEIDIFVTLAGRFDENRPLVATFRPAPIQVSFHDCATSGLAAMDYYLTDNILHPRTTEEKFTEQLYRLPTYYQYPTHNGLPVINESPVVKNGYITFCSFNKPEKIGEAVVKLWATVLHAIPNSRLLLRYFNHYSEPLMRERTIERFKAYDIDEDRLILNAAHNKLASHLNLYLQADIALDPFPFNGATTTFEALNMGVPVIALQGDHFVSRVATSLVTHIGHPEFSAETYDQYVDIAKDLTSNIDNLNSIRQSLRNQLSNSSLCNGTEYAKNIEAAFRDMWKTWCETGGYKGN